VIRCSDARLTHVHDGRLPDHSGCLTSVGLVDIFGQGHLDGLGSWSHGAESQ